MDGVEASTLSKRPNDDSEKVTARYSFIFFLFSLKHAWDFSISNVYHVWLVIDRC